MARRIGTGPGGGDPDPLPDPIGPVGTSGGGGGWRGGGANVSPSTAANQGQTLPIAYGTVKVPALLIEKTAPTVAQPDPWQSGTAYVVDQVCSNAGNAYRCVAVTGAATSAGASGPTGTGTGIVDGGALWNYVAPVSYWQPLTTYALNAYVVNGGKLYKATTGGVSGLVGSTGPFDTGPEGTGTLMWTAQQTATQFIQGWLPSTRYDTFYPDYTFQQGKLYVCVGKGTSGSAGSGPSVKTPANITDNNVTWVFVQDLPCYVYVQTFVAALAEGECTSVGQLWWDKQRFASLTKQLTFKTGPDALGQTLPVVSPPWDTSGYQHTALIYATATVSGTQAELPAIAVELNGIQFGGGTADVNPADILTDLFTHSRRGCNLPSSRLDTSIGGAGATTYRTYCDAAGLRLSMLIDSQRTALDVIRDLMLATNSGAVWSSGALKVIPLSDQSITAPVYGAVNYVPSAVAAYNLTIDDFLDKLEPVQATRRPDSDVFNAWPVEYTDRAFGYTRLPQEDIDQLDVDVRGEAKRASTTSLPVIFPDGTRAIQISRNLAQRSLQIRNEYRFRLSSRFCLLEPGDLLSVTESVSGLSAAPMRINSMEEAEDGTFSFICEDYPAGVSAAPGYQPQQGDGLKANDLGTTATLVTTANGTTSGLGSATVTAGQLAPAAVGAAAMGIAQVGAASLTRAGTLNLWPNPTSEIAPPPGADTSTPVYSGNNYTGSLVSGSAEWFRRCFTAPAWVASTFFSAGKGVTNGGNGYVCTTSGTSAGAGGPTGTSSTIADGGCVWQFMGNTTYIDAGLSGVWSRKLVQVDTLALAVAVVEGESYVFSAWAKKIVVAADGKLQAAFYDSYGNPLASSSVNLSSSAWASFTSGPLAVPAGAVWGVFTIYASNSQYLVDSISLRQMIEPGLVVGGVGGASPLTTKGDLYGRSTVDARIPVGTDATVLTADSTQPLGVKWAAASGGGAPWSLATKPTTPHADDEEFEGAATIGSTWTVSSGTPIAGVITPVSATASGTFLYDWNVSRKSWLFLLPGNAGTYAKIDKTITLPAVGDFLWIGFAFPTSTSWIQLFFNSNGLTSTLRFNVSNKKVEYFNTAALLVGSLTTQELNSLFYMGFYRSSATQLTCFCAGDRGAWEPLGTASHIPSGATTISLLANQSGGSSDRYGFDFFRHLAASTSGGALP